MFSFTGMCIPERGPQYFVSAPRSCASSVAGVKQLSLASCHPILLLSLVCQQYSEPFVIWKKKIIMKKEFLSTFHRASLPLAHCLAPCLCLFLTRYFQVHAEQGSDSLRPWFMSMHSSVGSARGEAMTTQGLLVDHSLGEAGKRAIWLAHQTAQAACTRNLHPEKGSPKISHVETTWENVKIEKG